MGKASQCVAFIATALPIMYIASRAFTSSSKPNRTVRRGSTRHSNTSLSHSHFEAGESKSRLHLAEKVVVVMVGLPARGKSYVSTLLVRYLNWFGCHCQIFNAGNKRRTVGKGGASANFFDPSNKAAHDAKELMAMDTLDELLEWLDIEGVDRTAVGIFDATNTTTERRRNVLEKVRERERADNVQIKVVFLECICTDTEILERNYRRKLDNKDYAGMPPHEALRDFKIREDMYKEVYEPVADHEDSGQVAYIKMIDAGAQFTMRNHHCASVHTQIGGLLQRVHLSERTITLALVGQTDNDVKGLLGGDSLLTEHGTTWAHHLEAFLSDKEGKRSKQERTVVLSGSLRRDIQMRDICAGDGKRQLVGMRTLNEMCAGDLDSLSYEQIDRDYPEQSAARTKDKLRYRFPGVGGESYQDVIQRLHEVIFFLEQSKRSVLVVVNKAVLRCLWAYFKGESMAEMPTLAVPGHMHGKGGSSKHPEVIIELRRTHSGFETNWVALGGSAAHSLPDLDEPENTFGRAFSF